MCAVDDAKCVPECRQPMQRGFQKRGELRLVTVHNEAFTETHWSSNNFTD